MDIKLPPEPEISFQMAPMIDITFLLLIFFMLVARQTQSQFKEIQNPVAENSTVAKQKLDRGIITIDVDENLYLGAYPATREEITGMVKDRIAQNPQFQVQLRIDARVRHEIVRDILKACAEGGALDIIFSTYQSES
ncbi:MAG: ExbD/TolR family protein [Kiritimatiellia bacterium]